MIDFLITNWEWLLVGYFVAEKIVKVTPTKADDITLDILWAGIKKVVGKG